MWSKLEVLYHIVKAGSLVNAARILNTDQPSLTLKLKSLEKKFGFKLINRSTPQKTLSLTRKGEEVFKVAEQSYILAQGLHTKLYSEKGLKGQVRITAPHAIANYILGPVLVELSDKYPEIEIELIFDDQDLDIVRSEFDLAIGHFVRGDSTLVQEPLFTLEAGLYASPAYLEKFGTPQTVEDLDHHRMVVFFRKEDFPYSHIHWPLKIGKAGDEKRKPHYICNSVAHMLYAASEGLGIIPSYEDMVKGSQSNLVRVLPDIKGPLFKHHLTYPKSVENVERIMFVRDFLKERLKR